VRKFYWFVSYLLLPVALIHLGLKSVRLPVYAKRWRERLGYYRDAATADVIWLHACSVGEVEASIALIRALQQRYPGNSLLVTTTTPTGSACVIREFGDAIQHVYLPFDAPCAVNAFFSQFKPRLAIIVEKEIWPNLFLRCQHQAIPLILVSAMLSERSFRRYLRCQRLFNPVFQAISKVGSQTGLVAKQFEQLGVEPDRIKVTGNLKFQRIVSAHMKQQALQLRAKLFGARPIWIAASTHDNEEVMLLDRLKLLQSKIPDLLLIIAPRHPHRGVSITGYCKQNSISCVSRSSGLLCQSKTSVYLLDTLGELMLFYGVSDLAFVGGSLVDVGCHNLLEPAAWGLPILFGQSVHNCEQVALELLANNAAIQVANADQCINSVQELLFNQNVGGEIGKNAKAYIDAHQSELGATMAMIDSEFLSSR
jgi:3-deoxy-D-manno-octulosonic-acid transferase